MNECLRVLPLGGCGEIGMNMTLIQTPGKQTYIVDSGALFPDPSLVGVKVIVPSVAYLEKHAIKPEAWFITHGHEDHIGALPFFYERFRAPIYSTRFTLELIAAKFENYKIKDAELYEWTPYHTTHFSALSVTPFYVNHSIPQATGFFIESPQGNILHMGDFRIDETLPDVHSTTQSIKKVISGKPVHLMLSDSTNSFKEGHDSDEGEIMPELVKSMATHKGALVVTSFSSNIWRLQTVIKTAKKLKRKVFLAGRSLNKNFSIAKDVGILSAEDCHVVEEDLSKISDYSKSEVCLMCTGSQGEIYSGLHNIVFHQLKDFTLSEQDIVVFSARTIPGNEKTIDLILNKLAKIGCQVLYGHQKDEGPIHVSGHGYKQDLEDCIKLARPKNFMPVHGTYRHLKKHAEIAQEAGVQKENCFVIENGMVLGLNNEKAMILESIPSAAGRLYSCAGGLFHSSHPIYKTRLLLSETGLASITLVVQGQGLKTICPPIVITKGVPIATKVLIKEANIALKKIVVISQKKKRKADDETVVQFLRKHIMSTIARECGYKCPVTVVLQRV
jgi:ribonuclease J